MDRGGDIPEGLEILDAEGAVIAAGTESAPPPTEPAPARGPRRWSLLAGAAAIVAVAGLVVVLLFADDEPAAEPPASLGMLAGAELAVSPEAAASYPLFGRAWQHELMVGTPVGWTFVDLNTGAQRTVPVPEDDRREATVRDGQVFVAVDDTIHRLDGDTLTEVWRAELPPLREYVSLGHGVALLHDFDDELLMFDVATGNALQPDPSRRIELAAGVAYAQQGQHIRAFEGSGTVSTWATGELLDSGAHSILWRSCDEAACSFWAGTPDDPRAVPLDATTAGHVFLERLDFYPEFRTSGIEIISPTGRLAWSIRPFGEPGFEIELVDLVTGDFAGLPRDGFDLGVFDPDETVLATSDDSEVLVVDTATGSVVAIPGVEASPGTLLFVPLG
ncbi:MAG: hypothetical protein DHS20C19_15720 [Acidimicrobiales bacterium]|nr:MAG: hypothetical protein DHS20C19_15720 [Acidimicrobiales bacterium]